MDLDSITAEIKLCTKCPLNKGRNNAVVGVGAQGAKVFFISEGPDENEDREGHPFVGEAGQFFDELLASIDLSRDDTYLTHVVKCRPPHNRDPLEEEVRVCTSRYLFDQIKYIKPKLIVTLGRHSMHVFFPQIKSVADAHGKAYKKAGQVYLILHNPSLALSQPALRETVREDFKKIPEIMQQIDESQG